jgi:hypothetical protein
MEHNILEPVLGRPFEKESKTTLMPKIWQYFMEHNILEPVLGRPSEKESKTTLMPKIW